MKPFQLYWDTSCSTPIIFDGEYYWINGYGTEWLKTKDEWYVYRGCVVLLFEVEQ